MLEANTVKENAFIGEHGAFFYINGGIATVERNEFSYSGYLSDRTTENHPNSDSRQNDKEFPFKEYRFPIAQDSGIFNFEFTRVDMPQGQSHVIRRNVFEHIYCWAGCAYSVRGSKMQRFLMQNNEYSYLVSKNPGAIFDGSRLDLSTSNDNSRVWALNFHGETIKNTFGGALSFAGNNVPITVI